MPKSFFVEVMGCRLEIVQDDDGKFIVPVGFRGLGGALKPAFEPALLFRKPLAGNVAQNVMKHGTGALNIDGCRVATDDGENRARPPRTPNEILGGGKGTNLTASKHNNAGRWPANLVHDGSDEVVAAFPQASGAVAPVKGTEASAKTANAFGDYSGRAPSDQRDGGGSAARFFYCAKTSKRDRDEGLDHLPEIHRVNGNKWTDQDYRVTRGERPPSAESGPRRNVHPTVKPTDLMAYLCRLVTPPGGVVLDPFMGSGSTGKAAVREGFHFVGIEREAEYLRIAQARISMQIAATSAQQIPPLQSDLFSEILRA